MPAPSPQFSVPLAKREKLGPEAMPQWWHPGRVDAQGPPESFAEQLAAFDPDLRVTWNPLIERWQVWTRAPRVTYHLCPGWRLLFVHRGPSGEYLPLDERVFARLYHASADKWGSGKRYFARLLEEQERDREKAEASARQDTLDRGIDVWKHGQIQVAMRGKSSGSKFSDYHA